MSPTAFGTCSSGCSATPAVGRMSRVAALSAGCDSAEGACGFSALRSLFRKGREDLVKSCIKDKKEALA
ncbi:hypothetical protein, potential small subunit of hyantoinase/(de)carboxylase [Aromatoleum aromaticum EbN1]|uniref:Uncharacterized protein n=1 Tax=Aromatoleum aromaticum (strain DSM 19018 / LMG 30748 / EbN1) TaxID=76114 RepID=Q5P601_AROAE|nr:hypothetical protein, potential small subunit of hyantoinase/(de)carboxylase [Aromatoleum aromaticum EbN1]